MPGAEFWGAGPDMTNLRNASGASHRPQAGLGELPRLVGRRPGARAARRQPRRQVRHGRRHAPADRPTAPRPTTAPSRHPALSRRPVRRLARGGRSGAPPTTRRCASTPRPTWPRNRIYTLMHDPQYRVAIAWQNTAYNQPPHPSFFIGDDMPTPPTPNIVDRRWHAAGSAAGHADLPAGDGVAGRRHGESRAPTADSSAAATRTSPPRAASRR